MKRLFPILLLTGIAHAGTLDVQVVKKFGRDDLVSGKIYQRGGQDFSIANAQSLCRDWEVQKPDSTWIKAPTIPDGVYKGLRFSVQSITVEGNTESGNFQFSEKPETKIQLAAGFTIKGKTSLKLELDIRQLLTAPLPISLQEPVSQSLIPNLKSAFQIQMPKAPGSYQLKLKPHFTRPALPIDNPLTKEKVELGESLFFDTVLSIDGTVSCAACHDPYLAFGDEKTISEGFESRLGTRNSMPLFNIGWKSSFFWDGRAATIREQVLIPIQDHREMAANLDYVLRRLPRRKNYKAQFDEQFGPGKITAEKLGMALEAYVLTMLSQESKFDRVIEGKETFTKEETRGRDFFYTPKTNGGGGCFQCHSGVLFTDHQFHSNGIKPTKDLGRYAVTRKDEDKNHFVTPSLRNIGISMPYMHDGRFKTLDEVFEHYEVPKEKRQDLKAFLLTLTDPQYQD